MSSEVNCPVCGGSLKVSTTQNPLRNVVRVYVRCNKCGFEKTYERPPEITLEAWLKGVLQKEKRS
ncbi:MAG: hypothetical protein QXW32_06545 [Nitrososphaerales archaeon]